MNTITSNSPLFSRGETVSAEPYKVDETSTQTRFFPKPVNLTLPGHTVRKFPAGMQQVPVQFLNDQWLIDNGMQEIPEGQPLRLQPQAPLGSQGYATAFGQSGVYDATMILSAVLSDEAIASADANARLAAENVKTAQENLDNALRIHANATAALIDAQTSRAASDAADREDRLQGGAGRKPKKETAKQKQTRELKFYEGLSDEDKAKWDGSTQEERDVWMSRT